MLPQLHWTWAAAVAAFAASAARQAGHTRTAGAELVAVVQVDDCARTTAEAWRGTDAAALVGRTGMAAWADRADSAFRSLLARAVAVVAAEQAVAYEDAAVAGQEQAIDDTAVLAADRAVVGSPYFASALADHSPGMRLVADTQTAVVDCAEIAVEAC